MVCKLHKDSEIKSNLRFGKTHHAMQSSLKWEEFKTSAFKTGFILNKKNIIHFSATQTLGKVQGKYLCESCLTHTAQYCNVVELRLPIPLVIYTNLY